MAGKVAQRILLVSLFSFLLEATTPPAQHVVRHAVMRSKWIPRSAESHFVAQRATRSMQGEVGAGLGHMMEEIRAVRVVLSARRHAGGWDEEYEAMEQQLVELEQMLKTLEAKEVADHLAHLSNHSELQSEIDRLKEHLQRLGLQHDGAANAESEAHSDHTSSDHVKGVEGAGHARADNEPSPSSGKHAEGGGGTEGSDGSISATGEENAIEAPHAPVVPDSTKTSAAKKERGVLDGTGAEAPGAPSVSSPDAHTAIDVDMQMPYGDLEPFGREDTAQELTEDSIRQSNEMVDQLERAEVAEEKRAVFRALTRLRGAAITSYDGIARSQTGNIDDYARTKQWRTAHPVHHLANDEGDVSKWAFPEDAADF